MNSFKNKNEKFPSLIVCDVDAAIRILNTNNSIDKIEYILFLDEPTFGSDTRGSPITKGICELMKVAPEITILASATLPLKKDVPNFVKLFYNKFNNDQLKENN